MRSYKRECYYLSRLEKKINAYLAEYPLEKGYALVVSVYPFYSPGVRHPQASGYAVLHYDGKAGVVVYREGEWYGEAHALDEWEQALSALARFMAMYKYKWKIYIWTATTGTTQYWYMYTPLARDVEDKLKGDCSG